MTYEQLLPLVLAALPASEPFILFGESFSGPLAVMAASRQPTNLIGLILCATFVTKPIPFIGWFVPILARSLLFRLFPPTQNAKAMIGGYSNPKVRELFAQIFASVSPEIIAFRVRLVFKPDVRNELKSCNTPILYIAAGKDLVVPARNLRIIRQIKPDMQVVTIDSPHGIPQTQPVQVAEAITMFAASFFEGIV